MAYNWALKHTFPTIFPAPANKIRKKQTIKKQYKIMLASKCLSYFNFL